MVSYNIYRFYSDEKREPKLQKSGLNLKQAIEYCNDPETSSRTSVNKRGGCTCEWFDGYSKA